MAESIWLQKVPEVTESSRYNNADFNWYMRMATNPPPVHPEVDMPLELYKEEDIIQLPH